MELCSVEGCGRPLEAVGLCRTHRKRKDAGLPMDTPIRDRKPGRTCSYPGCDRPHASKGWCEMHYQRVRSGKPLDDPVQIRKPGRVCSVPGCGRKHEGRGLCNMHIMRERHGIPFDAPEKVKPAGATRLSTEGYIDEKLPDGRWVRQHRLRMEQLLGRPLLSTESVHHIDGDRTNNIVAGPPVNGVSGNLELWSSSHPYGQRVEDKVTHAVALLSLYRPDLLA